MSKKIKHTNINLKNFNRIALNSNELEKKRIEYFTKNAFSETYSIDKLDKKTIDFLVKAESKNPKGTYCICSGKIESHGAKLVGYRNETLERISEDGLVEEPAITAIWQCNRCGEFSNVAFFKKNIK